jgi:hypothetical protein
MASALSLGSMLTQTYAGAVKFPGFPSPGHLL